MGQGSGPSHRLTFAERSELQRRVRAGETYVGAAAAVGCSSKSVQRLLAKTGGIKSRTRPRSPLRLSLAEREEISRGLLAGDSRRIIAAPRRTANDSFPGRLAHYKRPRIRASTIRASIFGYTARTDGS